MECGDTLTNTLIKWQDSQVPGNQMGELLGKETTACAQIDILTGYFYFGGIKSVQEALEQNPDICLRILVGMDAGIDTKGLVLSVYEYEQHHVNPKEVSDNYLSQLKTVLQKWPTKYLTESQDRLFGTYRKMIEENRLQIRKTAVPNHAKLYVFHRKDKSVSYCAGSSNFTAQGLTERQEFNIQVDHDAYNAASVSQAFEELWAKAVPICDFSCACADGDQPGKQAGAAVVGMLTQGNPFTTLKPFDACMKMMRDYLALNRSDLPVENRVREILRSVGFSEFNYQIDAVSRAKRIMERNGGVIIADVVGLGKSVMASLLACLTDGPGTIVAPPLLLDGPKGWRSYIEKFKLDERHWRAESLYDDDLDKKVGDARTIIIDEVHNLRNPNTKLYDNLKGISKGKRIICLSATPYNNRPEDLISLLDLFPGPEINGETKSSFIGHIKQIAKDYHKLYEKRRELKDSSRLTANSQALRSKVEELLPYITPLTVRRNRIDLLTTERYRDEVKDLLPTLMPPVNIKVDLTAIQNDFYNDILTKYFAGEHPEFKGALYHPQTYIGKGALIHAQTNLYSMICRFVVARWESSPIAFAKTLANLKRSIEWSLAMLSTHEIFFRNANYHLDDSSDADPSQGIGTSVTGPCEWDSIVDAIANNPKKSLVYATSKAKGNLEGSLSCKHHKGNIEINVFSASQLDLFKADLKSDMETLDRIASDFKAAGLAQASHDGKLCALMDLCQEVFSGRIKGQEEPQIEDNPRKIIVFSTFADTASYVREKLEEDSRFAGKILYADGTTKAKDAGFKDDLELHFQSLKQTDKNYGESKAKATEKMILVCTDVLSEGINLNQAGVVVNYDLSYNPVRIIQRLGRINRIDQKVFDRIYNVNFFPTDKNINHVSDISVEKMKAIQAVLGEDSCIFSADETPHGFLASINPEEVEKHEVNEETSISALYDEGIKMKQSCKGFAKEAYEAFLDQSSARMSRLSGAQNQLYIFRGNGVVMSVHRIPDIADVERPYEAVSILKGLKELFDACKDDPDRESLEFRPSLDDPLWKAYQRYVDRTGFMPGNTKLAPAQKLALEKVMTTTFSAEGMKADYARRIRQDKDFAKEFLQCREPQEYDRLMAKYNEIQKDNFEMTMLMGMTKEDK